MWKQETATEQMSEAVHSASLLIFIYILNNNVWVKADAHGVHLVAKWTRWCFNQAGKDSHKARSSLWPVLKTDETMVLGLGAPGSLQGPHDWAGILGLDHSWHATAESTGMKQKGYSISASFKCEAAITRASNEWIKPARKCTVKP